MDEAEFLDRTLLVAAAFRPAAPIDRWELFAGRGQEIADLFAIVAQPGQHAVIYGERGVGKTSLGLCGGAPSGAERAQHAGDVRRERRLLVVSGESGSARSGLRARDTRAASGSA